MNPTTFNQLHYLEILKDAPLAAYPLREMLKVSTPALRPGCGSVTSQVAIFSRKSQELQRFAFLFN
jgi:hypothetical protein